MVNSTRDLWRVQAPLDSSRIRIASHLQGASEAANRSSERKHLQGTPGKILGCFRIAWITRIRALERVEVFVWGLKIGETHTDICIYIYIYIYFPMYVHINTFVDGGSCWKNMFLNTNNLPWGKVTWSGFLHFCDGQLTREVLQGKVTPPIGEWLYACTGNFKQGFCAQGWDGNFLEWFREFVRWFGWVGWVAPRCGLYGPKVSCVRPLRH